MKIRTAESVAYRAAGVDVDLADTLKSGLQAKVRKTLRPEVLGAIGGYGNSIVDDFFIFNGTVRVPTSGYLTTGNTHEVTSAWNNNGNTLVLWDCGDCAGNTDEVYLSPFDVVHIMHVPQTRIRARSGQINYGFDSTGTENWASVGLNSTRDQTELMIEPASQANKIELVVVSGGISADVTPKAFSVGATTLTLQGLMMAGNAVVDARVKNTTVLANRLNVMVLTNRTLTVGIYRIEDPRYLCTQNVGGRSDTEIIDTLKNVYKQACIDFALIDSGTFNFDYDGSVAGTTPDCEADSYEIAGVIANGAALWKGQVILFLFKNSGIPGLAGLPASGSTPSLLSSFSYVFTSNAGTRTGLAVAHEVGHQLNLSTRNDDGKHHDRAAPPVGTGMLMRERLFTPPEEIRWMRQEDWKEANDQAGSR